MKSRPFFDKKDIKGKALRLHHLAIASAFIALYASFPRTFASSP